MTPIRLGSGHIRLRSAEGSGARWDSHGEPDRPGSSQTRFRVASRITLTGLVVPHRVIPYSFGDTTTVAW